VTIVVASVESVPYANPRTVAFGLVSVISLFKVAELTVSPLAALVVTIGAESAIPAKVMAP